MDGAGEKPTKGHPEFNSKLKLEKLEEDYGSGNASKLTSKGGTLESKHNSVIKNVVLVHGAFADGSGWEAVANILKNDGYKVSVAQPPETSYADDQKYTKAAIDAMDGPVVLVGHSYGGSIITEAGNHPNVAALVYIAAFALDEGESCASIEQALPQASKAFKPDSNNNWWIEQEHFAADFAADIPPEKAWFMAVSQVPISTDSFTHKVTSPAWKTKPTWYMVATARPVDQSGPGAHDGEARQGQDGRSECQPCGLHVSSEGNSQAHRRGCHLCGRPCMPPAEPGSHDSGPPPIQTTTSAEARMNVVV